MTASGGAPTDRLRARHRHTPNPLTASPDAASEGANRGVALGAGQLYDR